ncbi:hypothetical protein GA0115257_108847 [Streptomyces sp. LcepLS]|nr:hypothetical protein GA0115257_108847 [Streptomyces sp. LcepLS]
MGPHAKPRVLDRRRFPVSRGRGPWGRTARTRPCAAHPSVTPLPRTRPRALRPPRAPTPGRPAPAPPGPTQRPPTCPPAACHAPPVGSLEGPSPGEAGEAKGRSPDTTFGHGESAEKGSDPNGRAGRGRLDGARTAWKIRARTTRGGASGPPHQRRRCHFGHHVRGGVRRGGAPAPKTHRQARPSPPSPQLRQSLRRDALEPRPPLAQAPPPRPPRPDGAGAGRGAGRVRVGRPEPVALHAADAGADGVRPPPLRAAATRLGTARSPALGAPVRDAVAVRGRGVCGPVLGGLPPRSRRPRRTGHPQRSST